MPFKQIFFLWLFFLPLQLSAQPTADEPNWKRLEDAIAAKESLQGTRSQLLQLKKQAIAAHDDIATARSLYNLMRIDDLRTQDTFYFRNSAFMDSLIDGRDVPPGLKAIMHLLRARRLNAFDDQYHRFNFATYYTNNLQNNYAALTKQQRDSIAEYDWEAAVSSNAFTGVGVSRLLWLSASPDVFLFPPQFGDLVMQEKLNQSYVRYSRLGFEDNGFSSLPSAAFRIKADELIKQQPASLKALSAYRRWMRYREHDESIALFIEALARKYVFMSFTQDSSSNAGYKAFLKRTASSANALVSALAVYQLCLILNQEGNKYANGEAWRTEKSFFPQHRYSLKQALQLYNNNKPLLSRFPVMDTVLQVMTRQIKATRLSVKLNNRQLPGDPIPFTVACKNADTLFYRVVRLNAQDTLPSNSDACIAYLKGKTQITEGRFVLPATDDFNEHAVFLKLDSLPAGSYSLLFSDSALTLPGKIRHLEFKVSRFAPLSTDKRVYVLDSKTGHPVAGAAVRAFSTGKRVAKLANYTVNKEGFVTIAPADADSLSIILGSDTLDYSLDGTKTRANRDIYNKEDYDDLEEYYDEHLSMEVFTDRSIYRPGQTVHYKIILFTKDPATGEPMLVNRHTMRYAIFKSRLASLLKEDDNDLIELEDPFGHTIDSARLVLNDFGSFADSFILPKTAAIGRWSITGYADANDNEGYFEVEEYKRPMIALTMEKPAIRTMTGEPFFVTLKLRSFSGGTVGKVPVTYTVERSGSIPQGSAGKEYVTAEIAKATLYTNEQGTLQIPVADSILAGISLPDSEVWHCSYTIKATATDATGERAELSGQAEVTTRPVRIDMRVEKVYETRNIPPIKIFTYRDVPDTTHLPVIVKLYRLVHTYTAGKEYNDVDLWYYTPEEWSRWFPGLGSEQPLPAQRILVLDTVINTARSPLLTLDARYMTAGDYELTTVCKENGRIVGNRNSSFTVFDGGATQARPEKGLNYLPYNSTKPGGTITWYTSAKEDSYTISHILYQSASRKESVKNIYTSTHEQKGLHKWICVVPKDAVGRHLVLTRISVSGGVVYKREQEVYLAHNQEEPEIIVEKYRKVMVPGAKEEFAVSVKVKNEHVAAELLTTLYDASLDKLEKHHWELPRRRDDYSLRPGWESGFIGVINSSVISEGVFKDFGLVRGNIGVGSAINATGAEEIVVGYGTRSTADFAALGTSVRNINIRGNSSLEEYSRMLIIVDGEVYTGDPKSFDVNRVTDNVLLKGADAGSIYGSRASGGVLIISTKGPLSFLASAPPPVVQPRRNFNETAFFFPQVHADRDGNYNFRFVMPESATEWNWKMMAHTRNARFAYLEKQLQTQLTLMVQPNMPRVVYEGDRITLKSRISNLDTAIISGKANCVIEDVVTGEDITATVAGNATQAFSIAAKSSAVVGFSLSIPVGFIHPLRIVVKATAGGFADAEEHILPVLSSKILLRQSSPVQFGDSEKKTFPPPQLPADAVLYGVGMSVDQQPQAALISALPSLANNAYDGAEQTFNKLRANAVALSLLRTDTVVRHSLARALEMAGNTNEADAALPGEMAAASMPWLSLPARTRLRQGQLLQLLDSARVKRRMEEYESRLGEMQQDDGGIPWFSGGKSDVTTTAYMLAGFGQMRRYAGADRNLEMMIAKLYSYTENQLKQQPVRADAQYLLYALSCWHGERVSSPWFTGRADTLLAAAWQRVGRGSLHEQALLIINTLRFTTAGSPMYRKALIQLENIQQLAITDTVNGLHWKDLSDQEGLAASAVETMALLSEAFSIPGNYKQVNAGIIKWLLLNGQNENWGATKAAAAAIDVLQKEKGSVSGPVKGFTANTGGRDLTVSDDLLHGAPVAFTTTTGQPQAVTMQQQGTRASGAVTWYYFAKPTQADTLTKKIRISRQYSYEAAPGTWQLVTATTVLKPGTVVRVSLTIASATRLTYIQLSDPAVAALAPLEYKSGYHYSGDLSYYQSVKDQGMELFIEALPRGVSVINYELVVAHEGECTAGAARLQCMYRPEITAYSNVQELKTAGAE